MIAIIDYKAGNIASIKNAVERLGFSCSITNRADEILKADAVIFPGQGRAGQAMTNLKEMGLDKIIPKIKKPFLGICLGMQLLLTSSEEDSEKCLNVIPGNTQKLPTSVRIPNIGWSNIKFKKNSLFEGIEKNNSFYFAHSYYCNLDPKYILAKSNYGLSFPVIIKKDNFYGLQFHPEKSGKDGEKLLANFLNSWIKIK